MRLVEVHVTNYRSVEDSHVFSIQPDVTCLVGKNESGKTALLQALRRLNPTDEAVFSITADYPRRHLQQYKVRHRTPATAVRARFALSQEDRELVANAFGAGVLPENWGPPEARQVTIQLSRDFDNTLDVDLDVEEAAMVRYLVAGTGDIDPRAVHIGQSAASLEELREGLEALAEPSAAVTALKEKAAQYAEKGAKSLIYAGLLSDRVPEFMYFDDYDIMAGAASLDFLASPEAKTKQGTRTLLDLLALANTTPAALKDQKSYEEHKARLEGTENFITDEVFKYWKQNTELEVEFDVAPSENAQDPPHARGTHVLRVRIKNRKHRVTVPFDERSRGFVWFFSFLARFNAIAAKGKNLILLLDEPGLSLHASAQEDFLQFIDEKLASENHQVIYTTHSPFMIPPRSFERVRIVEDVPPDGTVVTADALTRDKATMFPLQAALGYSLAQPLFLGPNCLLVEGPSDLLYLTAMSDVLRRSGGTVLDPRWVVTPVAGAGNLGAFIALLGSNKLNIAVLMDFKKADRKIADKLLKEKLLEQQKLLMVPQFANQAEADIEDMFDVPTYLQFVNAAWPAAQLAEADLPQDATVLQRVRRALEGRGILDFDHYRPALEAIRIIPGLQLSAGALQRFERLFARVNGCL